MRKGWFALNLLAWNKHNNDRNMPWKGEKDPYKIWLSEIILQQTRVEQGWNYYESFVTLFPTVGDLAKASEDAVFKVWEGLGYYSRCRNLITTAKFIFEECGGFFPNTYEGLLSLKGVGPYTAAAIASFAYNLPYAVVDGNVIRIISRVFGIEEKAATPVGKLTFQEKATELLDQNVPGLYNQAIMDFGNLICKPRAPLCNKCPFQSCCVAFKMDKVNDFPVKEKKKPLKERDFFYFFLVQNNCVAIKQRNGRDIWHSLYELPLIELKDKALYKSCLKRAHELGWIKNTQIPAKQSKKFQQKLSHQHINVIFIHADIVNFNQKWLKSLTWLPFEKLNGYAFPKLIREYFAIVCAEK